jgi:hypothetical protein
MQCPGCPYGGLDLTEGLFKFFADESAGIIYGEWDFGGAPAPAPSPTPTPTPTPPPPPPPPQTTATPTSIWVAPTTTWTPTSSLETPTTTAQASSEPATTPKASSAPASSVPPAHTPLAIQLQLASNGGTVDGASNLNQVNYALLNFGALVMTV